MIMGFNVKQDRFAYGFKTQLKIANNCHYSLRINEVVGPQFVFQLPFMTVLCLLLSVFSVNLVCKEELNHMLEILDF